MMTDEHTETDGDSTFNEPEIIDSELDAVQDSGADQPPDPKDEVVENPGEVEYYESDLENLQGAVAQEADDDTN